MSAVPDSQGGATPSHGDARLLASLAAMQRLQDGPSRPPWKSEETHVTATVSRRRDLDTNSVLVWDMPRELFEFLPGEIHEHDDWRCRSFRVDRTYVTIYEVGAVETTLAETRT